MKKILQRLFIPKPSTAILISIPLYVLVGAVLAKEITGPVAYFAYFLSSYALVITCIAIARLILFGLYYLFLAILRLFIIRADRIYTESNDLRGEYKTY